MRTILFSLILSLSASAVCPDLTGKYPVCKKENGEASVTSNVIFSQKVVNGVTEYDQHEDSVVGPSDNHFIADNIVRTEVDADIGVEAKVTSACINNKLVVTIEADGSENQDGSEMIYMKASYSKQGNQLISELEGTVSGQEMNDLEICE